MGFIRGGGRRRDIDGVEIGRVVGFFLCLWMGGEFGVLVHAVVYTIVGLILKHFHIMYTTPKCWSDNTEPNVTGKFRLLPLTRFPLFPLRTKTRDHPY